MLLSMINQHWFKKWHGADLALGHLLDNDDKNLCCLESTLDVYELMVCFRSVAAGGAAGAVARVLHPGV